MSAYTKHVSFTFKVLGEVFSIEAGEHQGVKFADVKETRCNGHEDTHIHGQLIYEAGMGVWDWNEVEGGDGQIARYGSIELAEAILAYVNEHGAPIE